MEEVSNYNNNNNTKKNNNLHNIKISPKTFPPKELTNPIYNNNIIIKKSHSSNINNNITFKITEKECSDINSLVRNSVEKINDLLNSKEFNNNNYSKTFKRSSKNCIIEMLEKVKEKDKDKDKENLLKSKTLKESGVKTNFTFNINNFINVPNNQSKNESINKKTERYEDEDDFGIINGQEQTLPGKNNINNNINCKAKTNHKKAYNNNRTKNNNYINYGTNRHNNGKLFRNCVKKKKLFDDGISDNYNNNNINIVNYTKRQKNKKYQKLDTKEDKDKSITVNMKYKKNNININDNDNIINNNINHNTLNESIKNKKKDKDNNSLKYSISDDINNMKIPCIQKRNIINLNNFSPNIISINSLSDNRNIKNFILNNSKEIDNDNDNNNNKKNNIKENEGNKKIASARQNNKKKNYNNYLKEKYYYNDINIDNNNKNNIKNDNLKKYKNSFNNPINNNNLLKNTCNKGSFSKIVNKNKINPFNIITNTNENESFNNIDENEKIKTTSNKPNFKKESSENFLKYGYASDYYHKYKSNNSHYIHRALNKIYSKEFPNKIKTNNMMKLMLFLNEYLINNNLLDDYYDINNRNKLDIYSKFLCNQINIDFPREDDVNIDKMVNSAKKIQRMWRKKKIEKFIGKNNEENELKKMVINKYIRNAGFKIKKIIGLFNTLVEDFNNIGNEKEMEEMFYNIQQIIKRKLTSYEKNNLYKEYINSIIYLK